MKTATPRTFPQKHSRVKTFSQKAEKAPLSPPMSNTITTPGDRQVLAAAMKHGKKVKR